MTLLAITYNPAFPGLCWNRHLLLSTILLRTKVEGLVPLCLPSCIQTQRSDFLTSASLLQPCPAVTAIRHLRHLRFQSTSSSAKYFFPLGLLLSSSHWDASDQDSGSPTLTHADRQAESPASYWSQWSSRHFSLTIPILSTRCPWETSNKWSTTASPYRGNPSWFKFYTDCCGELWCKYWSSWESKQTNILNLSPFLGSHRMRQVLCSGVRLEFRTNIYLYSPTRRDIQVEVLCSLHLHQQ